MSMSFGMELRLEQKLSQKLLLKLNSALELVDRLKARAPEYLDLLAATTDEQFEAALDTLLAKAVTSLEKNKKNFASLDEEGLSGALALALTIPGLTITQEANSNGHVDITIEADHCSPPRTTLAEAKIYKSPSYHFKGLAQLISRYTTGRERRSLLIVYFKKANIAGLTKKLRNQMDTERPQRQKGDCIDCALTWSFTSSHTHSSGEDLQVNHVMCNLFIE